METAGAKSTPGKNNRRVSAWQESPGDDKEVPSEVFSMDEQESYFASSETVVKPKAKDETVLDEAESQVKPYSPASDVTQGLYIVSETKTIRLMNIMVFGSKF